MLAADYPDARHVRQFAMNAATDREIWDFAAGNEWTIVSKDGDFHQLSLVYGTPPKVIWVRVGNMTTSEIAARLRQHKAVIEVFLQADEALLVLGGQ